MTQRTGGALTPERILAFVDGELSEAEHREVAAAIAADPAAQAMAAAMRSSAAAAAPAFDEALEAPWPPRLTTLLAAAQPDGEPRVVAFTRQRRTGGAWRLAIAASLAALLLGLAGGYTLRGFDVPLRLAGDGQGDPAAARFTAALHQVLDRDRTGDTVDYSLPTASASGRVTLLGPVQTRSGMACREFSHAARRGNQSRTDNGIACRSAGGGWEILLLPVAQ
jgi:hypothetical protein